MPAAVGTVCEASHVILMSAAVPVRDQKRQWATNQLADVSAKELGGLLVCIHKDAFGVGSNDGIRREVSYASRVILLSVEVYIL